MTDARSILIVEDEPLIAMMLEDFLNSLGHTVRGTCETVECALHWKWKRAALTSRSST